MRTRPQLSHTSRASPAVIVVMVALCGHHPKFRHLFNLLPPNRNPAHKLAIVSLACHGKRALVPIALVHPILGRPPHVSPPPVVGEFHQGQFIFLAREASKVSSRRGRFARPDCEHLETVTIRNGGIQRTVCETCGHVSLKGLENLSGKASRRQFERASERASSLAG